MNFLKFSIITIFFGILFSYNYAFSQAVIIKGKVYEKVECTEHGHSHDDPHFKNVPLIGANIHWKGTTSGVSTDISGSFELPVNLQLPHDIVISYVGYVADTITISRADLFVEVILQQSVSLDEVVVTGRNSGAHYSSIQPMHTQIVTSHELQRAACCNLSEAFETNASVDVEYSDAVTGAQQIMLLGLAGTYSQILVENIPTIRGLGQPFGLGFIPGPWMESIMISKGSASVINGYESVTGQINVELKKPENSESLFYNFYVNSFGRLESTINAGVKINPRWSTMILAHGEYLDNMIDHNNNSFLDHPLMKKYNVLNRYRYDNPGVMESQFGFRIMQENREGGQTAFFQNGRKWGSADYYAIGINTNRYDAFAKTGFFLPSREAGSIGTQLSFTRHEQYSQYGLTKYDGEQNTFYANILYEDNIGNPEHKITTGLSYMYDGYNEALNDSIFNRIESVPGVFGQYTMHHHEHFTGIIGLRTDYHNIYGTFFTPRLHTRWTMGDHFVARASAGKGYRVPNTIAENVGILASSRRISVLEDIKPEEAWNYGASLTSNFHLFNNDASIMLEFYRTHFINQLIVDLDTDHSRAIFYNLDGKSYSNNFQVDFKFEPLRRLEVIAAYRLSDVKTTIAGNLESKPFFSRDKGLVSLSYATPSNNWQFDVTAQFNGKGRIPDTSSLPEQYRLDVEYPGYTILMAQITYKWKFIDLYVGGENLTNFKQDRPIIAYDEPFGEYFDASMVWGPIIGRTFYFGLRYTLE
ncbi:MAG: TonB-dependent receptor [Bacteroidetes bacterium]|nr:TonB-dependent receptor [Bacteroidota bacterium]